MSRSRLLAGKTAVITGCLQGIGRATMNIFAENGANIFACCQHETEEFVTHINDLSGKYNVQIMPVYFDLLDESAIKNAAIQIQKTKIPVSILVNIAGTAIDALFPMMTMEQLRKTFEINFFSQMLFTQYIMKLIQKNDTGSIVNVSSITAIDGNPGQLAYGASKAAIIAATKTLAMEYGPKGIRVNAVAPGVIQTPMTENLPKESLSWQFDRMEIKRLGTPEEVANVIMYLSSDFASYITGQVIRIDGGIG